MKTRPKKETPPRKKDPSSWRLTPGEKLWILRLSALLFAVSLLCAIGWGFKRFYFLKNPVFAIQSLDNICVESSGAAFSRMIMEPFGVKPGNNVFALMTSGDWLARLRASPNIRKVDAEIRLPSTLYVKVVERDPVASLDTPGRWVVDEEGVVFNVRGYAAPPPLLISGFEGIETIEPGQHVPEHVFSAIQLALQLARGSYSFRVLSIDAARRDEFVLRFNDFRLARINWPNMENGDREPSADMTRRLSMLSVVYASPYAIGSVFNVTGPSGRVAVSQD